MNPTRRSRQCKGSRSVRGSHCEWVGIRGDLCCFSPIYVNSFHCWIGCFFLCRLQRVHTSTEKSSILHFPANFQTEFAILLYSIKLHYQCMQMKEVKGWLRIWLCCERAQLNTTKRIKHILPTYCFIMRRKAAIPPLILAWIVSLARKLHLHYC